MNDEQVPDLIGSLAQLALAIGGLWAVVRLVVTVQFKMIQTAQDRNTTLESKMERLEARLDIEIEGHFECQRQLQAHKLKSSAEIAALQSSVETLMFQMNRPHRSTDPESDAQSERER